MNMLPPLGFCVCCCQSLRNAATWEPSQTKFKAWLSLAPSDCTHPKFKCMWELACGQFSVGFSFPSSSCSAQFQVALSSLLWLWCRRACLIPLNSHWCYCNLRLKAIGMVFQKCPPCWTWPLSFLPLRANNLGQRGVLLRSLPASAVLIPHSHHHPFQILFWKQSFIKKKKRKENKERNLIGKL